MPTPNQAGLSAIMAAVALFAAGCGDDTTTDTGERPLATEVVCEEMTSFHGDPAPDTVGAATAEEAIAEAAAQYGAASLAEESGDRSTWNIHDDDGNLVGTIDVGPAPAGGFIAGDHELCADAVDHGEEGEQGEEGEEGDTMVHPPEEVPPVAVDELPDPDAWSWAGDSGDVMVHLLVDFSVGEGFEPVGIEVSLDGVAVVSGQGLHRPEEHCNWWGPYDLLLDAGAHTIGIRTENGLELTKTFDVFAESSMFVAYYDAEDAEPDLGWRILDGTTGCD